MRLKAFLFFCFLFLFHNQARAQVEFTNTNLPIFVIETTGIPIPDEPRIPAHMGVVWSEAGSRNFLSDGFNHYDGQISIELRGSTSLDLFPKKSYRLETQDEFGENNNVPLLGLPSENDWILNGPFSDKTLLRNVLAYHLASLTGRYAPRTRFCELVINGEYMGLYILMEKIKRDANRVDISRLDANETSGDDLTGGYILKIDKMDNDSEFWKSPYKPISDGPQNIFYEYEYPDPAEMPEVQKMYIRDFITSFEDAMNSSHYADDIMGYNQYIDVDSFVDYFLVNEMMKNNDAYRISTFLYKDRDSKDEKLHIGPVWDFNLALGNIDFCGGFNTSDWLIFYQLVCPEDKWQVPFYWEKLFKEFEFRKKLKSRWEEMRDHFWSQFEVYDYIDLMADSIEEARVRNFERWPVLGEWVWPNDFVGISYLDEISYLKNFFKLRTQWMDFELSEFDVQPYYVEDYFEPILFPNPVVQTLNFSFYARASDYVRLVIYDASGKAIFEAITNDHPNGNTRFTYDFKFSSGVYYYNIFVDDRRLGVGKLLKY